MKKHFYTTLSILFSSFALTGCTSDDDTTNKDCNSCEGTGYQTVCVKCSECNGSGKENLKKPCKYCDGDGYVPICDADGAPIKAICNDCHGSGIRP